ncbi:hypothetical protein [Xanthomonas vasicola]|nr:hypothetical protein [Xanthomonas vasicola]MBV6747205.1 hypothetical protein [Xanthomonas vasicola pv. vasculorum NCPPB 890]MBV6892725.1 hypothetical protein [Xanthomonas vasicola pv. vasculorum]MDO6948487.1 hypothetical protein [Xanthomonas vasicola]MDO6960475.1 hypothetical protein [Xanthomonas vasicola]
MAKGQEEAPKISPEEQARIAKAARQLASYANFLRWAANFKRDEIKQHPNHARVLLLSPMQSGRFSFAIEESTILLGIQPFEAAWFASMPFDNAYVSDRLYLAVEEVACMDAKLPPLALGIFIDDSRKRAAMQAAKYLQPVRVTVKDGRVADVGRALGLVVPLKQGDVVKQLVAAEADKIKAKDIGRWF